MGDECSPVGKLVGMLSETRDPMTPVDRLREEIVSANGNIR